MATRDAADPVDILRHRGALAYARGEWHSGHVAFAALADAETRSTEAPFRAACCATLAGDSDSALRLLWQAVQRGFRERARLEADNDLTPLSSAAQWRQLVEATEENRTTYVESVDAELLQIFEADQTDRANWGQDIDWAVVADRDQQRHERVLRLAESGRLAAADDWYHAAMVMQHGHDLADFERAHLWAKRAATLDPNLRDAKWLAAAAKDRWLNHQGKPQRYGTQFEKNDRGEWTVSDVDPSVTDEERALWAVPPLAHAHAHAQAMNERQR